MNIHVVTMCFGEAPMGFPVAAQIEVAASMDLDAATWAWIAAPMDRVVAIRAGATAGNGFLTR